MVVKLSPGSGRGHGHAHGRVTEIDEHTAMHRAHRIGVLGGITLRVNTAKPSPTSTAVKPISLAIGGASIVPAIIARISGQASVVQRRSLFVLLCRHAT